jgi:hypothetical protein
VSDFDTVVVDSLKALDPNRPTREADLAKRPPTFPLLLESRHCSVPSACPVCANSDPCGAANSTHSMIQLVLHGAGSRRLSRGPPDMNRIGGSRD